jgi:hypothetical protein
MSGISWYATIAFHVLSAAACLLVALSRPEDFFGRSLVFPVSILSLGLAPFAGYFYYVHKRDWVGLCSVCYPVISMVVAVGISTALVMMGPFGGDPEIADFEIDRVSDHSLVIAAWIGVAINLAMPFWANRRRKWCVQTLECGKSHSVP